MGLVNCPDCGKSISELAPICIQCGRPMLSVNSQESSSWNGDNKHLPKEHAKKIKLPPSKMFKIFAGVFAAILCVVLAGIIIAATGDHRPHNMAWTFLWIWLTIVSCREIGFKALLYYPGFLAMSIAIYVFANSIGSAFIYIAGNVIANIGGLILFYASYSKAIKSYPQNKESNIQSQKLDANKTKCGILHIDKKKSKSGTYNDFSTSTKGERTLSVNTKPSGIIILINGKNVCDVTPLTVSINNQELTIDYVYKNAIIASKEYDTTKTGLSVFENFSEILYKEYNVEPGLRRCLKCLIEFKDFDDKCPVCGSAKLTVPI